MKSSQSSTQKGAALIVTLFVLILIAVVTVSFLFRSSTERRASSADRASAQALALADMGISVVQAQINEATQETDLAWATQPGLIRTFDDTGDLVRAYKLYSATTLTSNSIATLKSEDLPPSGWESLPAVWTDLNAWLEYDGDRRYPILDPRLANDPSKVEGLSIAEEQAEDAPMPVRWLYVLEDGRLVPPQGAGQSVSVPGSEDSPIVGRVAFWTDDESCKVNINTAGQGTYWDTPRACSTEEGKLANSQPFLNEFQRYPGHPATTSLQAVFPSLSGQQILENLTPRYRWGGSEEGTVPTDTANPILDLRGATDRLYSSVDELVFAANRDMGILGRDEVERRRFLLTAHSRVPELNLFNLPRIAIWPLHATDSPTFRTEIDREIARAATINAHPYYFQRETALDPTADFAIARNLTLYSYLENLTARAIPGFGGGSFADKYPAGERQQILTEILDYIRTANLFDTVLDASGGTPFTPGRMGNKLLAQIGHGQAAPLRHPNGSMGFGRFYTISEVGLHFIASADEAVDPSNDPDTNLTLDENTPLQPNERRLQAAFLIELFSPAAGWTILRPSMGVRVEGLEHIQVNGKSIFPTEADGTTQINASQRSLIGASASGGNPGIRYPLFLKYAPARGRISADAAPTDSYASWAHPYPFISNFFTVDASTSMQVTLTKPLRITLFTINATKSSDTYQVQTIEIPLTNTAMPTKVPTLASDSMWWTFSRNSAEVGGNGGRLDGLSLVQANWTNPGRANARWFNENDVAVSWLPSHGDYRLLAGSAEVDSANSPFIPHPSWTAANSFATTFYDSTPVYLPTFSPKLTGFYAGEKYRAAINYGAEAMPDYPPGADEVTTGDWDRGVPTKLDGPYINKPDEGTIVRAATPTWYGDYPYFADTATAPQDIGTFFSPTRQMPSPGVFGSLPTGLARGIPWQTLLFRPQPGHPGWDNTPRDHLIMDLFWMPIAEPYAISEPFSTAGKLT